MEDNPFNRFAIEPESVIRRKACIFIKNFKFYGDETETTENIISSFSRTQTQCPDFRVKGEAQEDTDMDLVSPTKCPLSTGKTMGLELYMTNNSMGL